MTAYCLLLCLGSIISWCECTGKYIISLEYFTVSISFIEIGGTDSKTVFIDDLNDE